MKWIRQFISEAALTTYYIVRGRFGYTKYLSDCYSYVKTFFGFTGVGSEIIEIEV